jgi:hypothetical protein
VLILILRAEVWLVADLSHDVMAVTLLDKEPPEDWQILSVHRQPPPQVGVAFIICIYA